MGLKPGLALRSQTDRIEFHWSRYNLLNHVLSLWQPQLARDQAWEKGIAEIGEDTDQVSIYLLTLRYS